MRIGDETLRRQTGPIQITKGETGARDVQIARDAFGGGLQAGIQHQQSSTRDRSSHRDVSGAFDPMKGRPDGRLGGTIEVDDFGTDAPQPVGQSGRKGLASGQNPQPAQRLGFGSRQGIPQGRSGLHDGGSAGSNQPSERRRMGEQSLGCQDHARATDQRQVNFKRSDIETDRGHGEQPV